MVWLGLSVLQLTLQRCAASACAYWARPIWLKIARLSVSPGCAVLCCAGRAAHFRARLSSGMRDAHDCQHKVRHPNTTGTAWPGCWLHCLDQGQSCFVLLLPRAVGRFQRASPCQPCSTCCCTCTLMSCSQAWSHQGWWSCCMWQHTTGRPGECGTAAERDY